MRVFFKELLLGLFLSGCALQEHICPPEAASFVDKRFERPLVGYDARGLTGQKQLLTPASVTFVSEAGEETLRRCRLIENKEGYLFFECMTESGEIIFAQYEVVGPKGVSKPDYSFLSHEFVMYALYEQWEGEKAWHTAQNGIFRFQLFETSADREDNRRETLSPRERHKCGA